GSIITTRVYEERLATLAAVRRAGITVCCGGILGMGEREADRIGLLQQLSALKPHPESVPINMLVRVAGTPLANAPALDPMEMVRAIATARILMPASRVRLAAGRKELSEEAVALCFLAGANSIFVGEKLLTTPKPGPDEVECEFAEFAGTEAALYFGSGYAANVGLLTSLLGKNDLVFSDALNHASIIDGIRLSGARKAIYAHGDLNGLEGALKAHAAGRHSGDRC